MSEVEKRVRKRLPPLAHHQIWGVIFVNQFIDKPDEYKLEQKMVKKFSLAIKYFERNDNDLVFYSHLLLCLFEA